MGIADVFGLGNSKEIDSDDHVSYCRWALFAFPWASLYPTENPIPGNMDLGPKSISGIRSINFERSKSSPANVLVITIIGPVHWAVVPGTWCVLRSSAFVTSNTGNKKMPVKIPEEGNLFQPEDGLPRFIGQIATVTATYAADGEGKLRRVTTVKIREWSDIFNISVRFDDLSVFRSISQGLVGSGAIAALGGAGGKMPRDELSAFAANSFNPFEFAQLAFRLAGAISAEKMDNETLKSLNIKYPEVAATLPKIPEGLLANLGIEGSGGDIAESGFLNYVFGVQDKEIPNTLKDFYGIYPKSVVDELTTPGSGNPHLNRNPDNRPVSSNKIHLFFEGVPVWELVSKYTDPVFNEIYTDFLYHVDEAGLIGATPCIFMRDKPFLLAKDALQIYKNIVASGDVVALKSGLKDFTKYDLLPRITLSSAFITAISVTNTFLQAPNYIRLNTLTEGFGEKAQKFKTTSAFGLAIYRKPEMDRFGGHEMQVDSIFLPRSLIGTEAKDDGGFGFKLDDALTDFYKKMHGILEAWHCNSYRLGTATLHLKDPGYPLTVGHNLTFQLGKVTLVGHIQAIRTAAACDDEGKWTTNTEVELSHLVKEQTSKVPTKILDYIPLHQFANLAGEPPKKSEYMSKDPPSGLGIESFTAMGEDDTIGEDEEK